MADSTLLSVLAGTDPQAAQMLAAGQGIQLGNAALDPAFGHNEGPFGALAKTIAGIRGGGMLNNAAQQIIPARQAALPELAQVYASEDPLKAVASGNYSPQTLSMALSGVNPLNAAQAREAAANAALGNLNVRGFQAAQGSGASAPNGISAPASRGVAPPIGPMTSGPPVSGRPAQEPIQGAMPSDPVIAAASMSPQQRQQLIANPQARAMLLQRLRVLAQQHGQQAAAPVPSGVPSLGITPPPT